MKCCLIQKLRRYIHEVLFDTFQLYHAENRIINSDIFNGLNILRDLSYTEASNRGWHHDDTDEEEIKNFGNYTANLHSEVSELWEAWRKKKLNARCDKADLMEQHGLEPLTCAEEECADILIRTLDTAARLKVDLAKAVYYKLLFNRTREIRHGGKLA